MLSIRFCFVCQVPARISTVSSIKNKIFLLSDVFILKILKLKKPVSNGKTPYAEKIYIFKSFPQSSGPTNIRGCFFSKPNILSISCFYPQQTVIRDLLPQTIFRMTSDCTL